MNVLNVVTSNIGCAIGFILFKIHYLIQLNGFVYIVCVTK